MRKPKADLSRDSLTKASRIMLPSYPLVCFWLGMSYLLTPTDRIKESPALSFLDHYFHLQSLGVAFLFVGGFQFLALGLSSRLLYQIALACLAGVELAVGCIFVGASIASNASYGAGAHPLFIGVAAWASLLSINSRETDPKL